MKESWFEEAETVINKSFDRFVNEIKNLCTFSNVSALKSDHMPCAMKVVEYMKKLDIETKIYPMGGVNNPPLIYGTYSKPKASKTLMIYGHYDVQSVEPLNLWESDPFVPVVRDGCLFARGAHDDKGQFFISLKALEILQRINREPSVNLVFVIDPEEEIGSPSLETFVLNHQDLFDFIDFGCSIDGEKLEDGRFPILFGNRGNCHVTIRLRTAKTDVHSGMWGGVMPNAAWRMISFLNTLTNDRGKVSIEGFYDSIVEPSKDDLNIARNLEFNSDKIIEDFGINRESFVEQLYPWERIMFHPTCEISGFSSGQIEDACKSIIPGEAKVQLDLRLVPDQDPYDILKKLKIHARECGFPDVEVVSEGMMYKPGRASLTHPLRSAAEKAIFDVDGRMPVLIPSAGGSNPGSIWNKTARIPLIEIPCGQYGGNAHSPNEHLNLYDLKQGLRIFCRFLTDI
jgi:acetylornithine deacetylase/succinyl-diaminopimelate desuccinylase-like protein